MLFSAIVKLLSSKEDGRINAPQSGYRPQLKLGDVHTSCIIRPQNGDKLVMDFDIEHQVYLELVFPEYQDKIKQGIKIEFYEGARLIGRGEIINNR